jgi:uncharacterized protein YacL
MRYSPGEEIEVIIDRDGLGMDEGVAHLPDDTLVVVAGAGGKVGKTVQAIIMSIERTALGNSVRANAKM